jgi:hypothetical protein
MASPLPGMDPYLEPHWLDVHTSLVAAARRALNADLPSDLVARVEERVAVESNDEPDRLLGPDVRVFTNRPGGAGKTAAVIDAPFKLAVADDPVVERFIRIVDRDGHLVTVIEFVSPANKRQPGRRRFKSNRRQLLASGVNFVEIDLVRAGSWRRLMSPNVCPAGAVAPYRAIVYTPRSAADGGSTGYLFPISIREPLPDIPIPLRPGELPVTLRLQTMLASVYDEGRYGRTLRYDRAPVVKLDAGDAEWVWSRIGSTWTPDTTA